MKSKLARFSSTEWPLAFASGLLSPTMAPWPPLRGARAPAAISMASIRLVLPPPVGPTKATARTTPGACAVICKVLRKRPRGALLWAVPKVPERMQYPDGGARKGQGAHEQLRAPRFTPTIRLRLMWGRVYGGRGGRGGAAHPTACFRGPGRRVSLRRHRLRAAPDRGHLTVSRLDARRGAPRARAERRPLPGHRGAEPVRNLHHDRVGQLHRHRPHHADPHRRS